MTPNYFLLSEMNQNYVAFVAAVQGSDRKGREETKNPTKSDITKHCLNVL